MSRPAGLPPGGSRRDEAGETSSCNGNAADKGPRTRIRGISKAGRRRKVCWFAVRKAESRLEWPAVVEPATDVLFLPAPLTLRCVSISFSLVTPVTAAEAATNGPTARSALPFRLTALACQPSLGPRPSRPANCQIWRDAVGGRTLASTPLSVPGLSLVGCTVYTASDRLLVARVAEACLLASPPTPCHKGGNRLAVRPRFDRAHVRHVQRGGTPARVTKKKSILCWGQSRVLQRWPGAVGKRLAGAGARPFLAARPPAFYVA